MLLDATVISANSAEEIKSAIKQEVADGKTAIRLNLASDAGDNEFKAIREAFKNVERWHYRPHSNRMQGNSCKMV